MKKDAGTRKGETGNADPMLKRLKYSSRLQSLVEKAAGVIRISDWSFDTVSDEEARYCYYYEYLRGPLTAVAEFNLPPCDELRSLASLAFSHDLIDQNNELWRARERVNAILNVAPSLLPDLYKLLQPPWPDVSWQDLAERERKRRLRDPNLVVSEATLGALDEATADEKVSADDLATARSISADFAFSEDDATVRPPLAPVFHGGRVIHVAGAFRAGAFHTDIIETFRERLMTFRESHPEAFEERDRGRRGFKDRLRKLGALRVYCLVLEIHDKVQKTEARSDLSRIEHLLREALESDTRSGHRLPNYHGRGLRMVAKEAFQEMKALFNSNAVEDI